MHRLSRRSVKLRFWIGTRSLTFCGHVPRAIPPVPMDLCDRDGRDRGCARLDRHRSGARLHPAAFGSIRPRRWALGPVHPARAPNRPDPRGSDPGRLHAASGGGPLRSAGGRAHRLRWNRPWVVGEENVARAQGIVGGKRWIALVPIFLVPFSPSDAICFVAGMIGIKPDRFFLAVLIGRVPKDCALALAGAGLIRLGGLLSASG